MFGSGQKTSVALHIAWLESGNLSFILRRFAPILEVTPIVKHDAIKRAEFYQIQISIHVASSKLPEVFQQMGYSNQCWPHIEGKPLIFKLVGASARLLA